MIRRIALIGTALPALLTAGGCAMSNDGRYPSLLPRAIEQRDQSEPIVPVPVAVPDPALDAQLAMTDAAVAKAAGSFSPLANRAEAAGAAAKGQAVGSDPWLAAQAALADLDAVRADTASIVADLERMAIDRAAGGSPPYPALEAALARAQAMLDAQTQAIARLQAALPQA